MLDMSYLPLKCCKAERSSHSLGPGMQAIDVGMLRAMREQACPTNPISQVSLSCRDNDAICKPQWKDGIGCAGQSINSCIWCWLCAPGSSSEPRQEVCVKASGRLVHHAATVLTSGVICQLQKHVSSAIAQHSVDCLAGLALASMKVPL